MSFDAFEGQNKGMAVARRRKIPVIIATRMPTDFGQKPLRLFDVFAEDVSWADEFMRFFSI